MCRKMVKDALAELTKNGFSEDFQYYPQTEVPADMVYYTYNASSIQNHVIVLLLTLELKFYCSSVCTRQLKLFNF